MSKHSARQVRRFTLYRFLRVALLVEVLCLVLITVTGSSYGVRAPDPQAPPAIEVKETPEAPPVIALIEHPVTEAVRVGPSPVLILKPHQVWPSDGQQVKTGLRGVPPLMAIEAYERGAEILASAAPKCRISWEMLASVGALKSSHGVHYGRRYPSVYQYPAVEAKNHPRIFFPGRAAVQDSDGGEWDGLAYRDRPVGPLGIYPHWWKQFGVDADQDGRRNPQDFEDAALGLAVALCSSRKGLDKPKNLQRAYRDFTGDEAFAQAALDLYRTYKAAQYQKRVEGAREKERLSNLAGVVVELE